LIQASAVRHLPRITHPPVILIPYLDGVQDQTKDIRSVSKPPFPLLLERVCKVDQVRALWRSAMQRTSGSIYQRVLDEMEIAVQSAGSLNTITASGPLVVVANHPFGMVEGPVLGSLVEKVRDDFMFVTNSLLMELPELAPRIIGVDPFGGAAVANSGAIRKALLHLKGGGALVVFPAGEVSAMRPPFGRVEDPEWNPMAARLAIKSGARVVPVFFEGRNRAAFQLAGLVHPRLRTFLLPSELLSRRGDKIRIALGQSVRSSRFHDANEMSAYLRNRVYALASHIRQARVSDPVPPAELQSEMEGLQPILKSGPYEVYLQSASAIPTVLREIGRLREVTFRAAGEGTGRPADLDEYDRQYWHLFVWHRDDQRIAGAYRMAAISELTDWRDAYTSTLFHFPRGWQKTAPHAIELGRSFVCDPYQRDFLPLLLLWKGIGAFVMARPHIRYLYGPVSISANYTHASRSTIARELSLGWTGFLPRNPLTHALTFTIAPSKRPPSQKTGVAVLEKRVESLEPDAKGLPVLLRQYLNMGGEILCWNLDRGFGNALDGLVLLDLERVPERLLNRYLGKEAVLRYRGCKAAG
jgi:putative hemolysin